MNKKAIYPGTFDPITYGHLNILERSTMIFGKIILAVSDSISKKTMFSLKERVFFAKEETKHLDNVEVIGFSELIVNFAYKHRVNILIRSIRSISDFEYEYKFAHVNQYFMNNIETIFLLPSPRLSIISSSLIKEIARYGGNLSSFLSENIAKAIFQRIS